MSDREEFEQWYAENAFDYVANPIGSRDSGLQWKAWQACAELKQQQLTELEAKNAVLVMACEDYQVSLNEQHRNQEDLIDQRYELEHKLAEQQAELFRHRNHAHCCLIQNSGEEELNNLLAKAKEEGRKEAVPEGWQVVPKEPTGDMLAVGYKLTAWCVTAYKAMLAAAPKP